jgi:hypothetical protein
MGKITGTLGLIIPKETTPPNSAATVETGIGIPENMYGLMRSGSFKSRLR